MTVGNAPRRRVLFVAANTSIDRLHRVDHLVPGAIHRPDLVVAVPGGKGLNAARAAAALGVDVVVAGIVGGRAGEWIADRLAALGIRATLVQTAAETRTCVSILDRSRGQLTESYEPGEAIDPDAWERFGDAVARELEAEGLGVVTMSGSLPLGAPVDGYARIVRLATSAGITAIVDAHGAALEHALAASPAIVKVNAAEAGASSTVTGEVLPAARSIIARGAGAVVVTLGVDGAIVVDASGSWRLSGPTTSGTYPVGSGDAFLAGLAAGIVGGRDLVDAATEGMAAGFANAQVPGAGVLDPAVVKDALRQVTAAAISEP